MTKILSEGYMSVIYVSKFKKINGVIYPRGYSIEFMDENIHKMFYIMKPGAYSKLVHNKLFARAKKRELPLLFDKLRQGALTPEEFEREVLDYIILIK